MSSYQTIETPQDYVNYTFNITSRGVTEVAGEMAGLSNTVTTILGQLAFKTSEYLTHTESLVIGLGTASVAAFASATQHAIKFEQAIANVQAIGGESIDAAKIGEEAMKYSSQFGMDVNSMTEGLEALSRAGLTATNVMSGVLAEGVKLSKLEGMDLEDSINNLISTTNLLATEDLDINSQEYADAVKAMNQHIVSTSESAPINAENIIQTLQHVGGYASANNINQEDLFAVIAQLGAKGTKGEMAGTALRAFIAAGQKDQAQRALNRIGLNVNDLWDSSGQAMLPVSEMKDVIDNALEAKGYSKQEKLEFYSDFAGYKQANQIMKIDTSEVKEYKENIAQAWDLGKKLETILGTTHNNLQTLYQTTKNFMTKVGKTVLPIINAIIIPLKWGVKLLDAMPFSENIVGMLATMAGIKAVLLFINRVVPTLASMYTNFSGAEKKAKGIRGYVHDTVEDIRAAKDILTHLNDPTYLSGIRIQQGLMGEQSYKMHREVTEEVYKELQIINPDLPDWGDLEGFNKEAISDLMESYKKTDLYKQKQTIKANKIKNINERLEELLLGKKETKKADVQWRKSNLDTNNEQHNNNADDFVNATEAIQELAKNLEKTSDEKALEKAKNNEQRDITKSILNAKNALAEAIAREVSKQLNGKETLVSDTLGSFQMYDPKSSKITEQLRQIESDVSNNLGDIGYFLNYDLEKIDNLLANVRYDLQRKITAYTNNNPNFINDEQDRRMSKIISGAAKTNLGHLYSTEQNNIDIHNVLTTGKWNNPGDKSPLGIHDKQMRAMEEALHIDVRDDLERTDRLNRIHKELNYRYEDDAKKDKIAEILKITQDIWEKDISHQHPSGVASQYLTNTRAAYIGNTLGLNGINWHQIENPAEELINYFADTPNNSKKQMQLKQADRLMFSIMESAKSEEHIFNEAEADELGYIIRRYRQLLLARNKNIEKQNKTFSMNVSIIDEETYTNNSKEQQKGQVQYQRQHTLQPSQLEKEAYSDYLHGQYEIMKDFLRTGKDGDKEVQIGYKDGEPVFATIKELTEALVNFMNKAPGLYENMILFHGGPLYTRNDGTNLGFFPDIRSVSWNKEIASKFTTGHSDRYQIKIFAPTGTKGVLPDSDIWNHFEEEEEYTLMPEQPYIELFRDDTERYAEILLLPFNMLHQIVQNQSLEDLEFVPSYWDISPMQDFLKNTQIVFDESIEDLGQSIGNTIYINPDLILKNARQGLFKSLPTGITDVYIHEAAHNMLQHNLRTGLSDLPLGIPELDFSFGGYTGQELVAEFEADSVIRELQKRSGVKPSKMIKKRWDLIKNVLEENDAMQYVNKDLINSVANSMYAFPDEFFGALGQAAYNKKDDKYNKIGSSLFGTNNTLYQRVFSMKFFDDDILGNGIPDDSGYEQDYEYINRLAHDELYPEDFNQDDTQQENNIDSQYSEIKKFLTTITQHLSDFTKFFSKTDNKLDEIILLLGDIADRGETTIINNINNTLNVFRQNMEQGVKSLPEDIGNTIKEGLLLPQSTIKDEDIIDVQALVVEDVEKAVLMIESAYIAPQHITDDNDYKESNMSLRQLYDEVYGSESLKYDTPPLLGSLLALPEKIQEVTTDFVLLGEAIDSSKEALEGYLLRNTTLLMLSQGSPKGYHNAYPDNAGIFPPLPTDTLTLARNLYTQRVISEPYNVTEQQLRSVGLHGLVPFWQQNLQKFTPYDNPIGPNPDNTDYGKYQQYLAIEEERHRLNREKDAKAEADLQQREAEKLAGITERYDAKMAARKERNDKKAAEEAEKIRQRNKDNADRRRALEDKVSDAVHSSELNDHIIGLHQQEKEQRWNDIEYRRHRNSQSTTLGMSGYYNYLNEIGIQQHEQDRINQERLDAYNQIQNDLLIKEARRLAPLYQQMFTNYTTLNDIIEQEIESEKNLKGATDDLISIRQYPTPIGPEPAPPVGDRDKANDALQRLKERREKQLRDNAYTPSMGTYYAQIWDYLPHGVDPEPIKMTALEQAALMKKQNDSLEEQQKEFLNIADTVSKQAEIEEQKRKAIEESTKAYNELLTIANAITNDIKIRYAKGEVLSNEELMGLPNDKGAITKEIENNPQRAVAMMFDRFDQEQASRNRVRNPLSLLEREAYTATRLMYESFERQNQKVDEYLYIISNLLGAIYKLESGETHVLLDTGNTWDEFIETSLVTDNLKEKESGRTTVGIRGGIFYGGTEEDVNAFSEDWDKNTKSTYKQQIFWTQQARKMKDKFYEAGKSVDDFLDRKLNKFSDDPAQLGVLSKNIKVFTYDLESLQDAMTKAGKIFPPFLAISVAMEGIIGVLSVVTTGLATAETILTAARMLNTEVTKEEAKAEGKEAAWQMAQRIKKYTEGHKNIEKIIEKGSKRIAQMGNAAIKGVDAVLGFIIENIAILGPIAAAIAIAVGALWLSEQNHAKALKEATKAQEEAMAATKASYMKYESLHKARQNETDAIKRQQLARKESIALYELEANRLKQLNAIKKETELRNDGLWGEYGLRAALQKIGLGFIAGGDFESQYKNYDGSTDEIRRIKEDALGNIFATNNQRAVSAWYDAHIQQLGQIEAFAPELQELYDLESKLIEKYGSLEAARDSEEFQKAVQEFSDATGLNKETAEKYLDYLQMEANVENARNLMQAEVSMITAEAHANAYKILYGDETGMGDTEEVEDAMVYATADQIFKDAYNELWWSMLMEWLQAIYYTLTLNLGEAGKHAAAAGAYQDGMRELAENQQRITQEGVDIAKEDQRREYENQSYSYYGDQPFGGATESAVAHEQDWAEEEMNRQDSYYTISYANGEAATQGFKDGLNQHSPGDISRSVGDEMEWALQAMSGDLGFERAMTQQAKNMEKGFSIDGIYGKNSTIDFLIDTVMRQIFIRSGGESPVANGFYQNKMLTEDNNWTGGNVFESTGRRGQSVFSGFNKIFNKAKNVKVDNSKTEIHIHTLNINTEDDPEKIKTAFMNLMIELGEQVVPRQVSRTIGEPPASAEPQATNANDPNATDPNNPNSTDTNNNNNNNNNNNTNPTG